MKTPIYNWCFFILYFTLNKVSNVHLSNINSTTINAQVESMEDIEKLLEEKKKDCTIHPQMLSQDGEIKRLELKKED